MATSCASECLTIAGFRLDEQQNCFTGSDIIACWGGTGGINAQNGCIRDLKSGVAYMVGSTTYIEDLVASGEWSVCSTTSSDACP
ncbi:MAG: hypothetical protein IPI67_23400 [Myxococcales bacterium]|nr:hypothetical protein [Myxococcales bacterium]